VPYGIAVHPDGSRVYATISDFDAQIAVIYPQDNFRVERLPLTGAVELLGIQISPDGNLAFAANIVPPF
jgi:DNA-binding beta-propeller fold protein YncE